MTAKPDVSIVDGTPYSNVFDDVYFSKGKGLDESYYVFLEGNQLAERFKSAENFHIGETGFGSGLNFLCAWQLFEWLNQSGILHFTSIELYPFSRDILIQTHSAYPALSNQSETFLQHYKTPKTYGTYRMEFSKGRIILDIIYADINDAFPHITERMDCWFLDGFDPAKNPDMWSQDVCHNIYSLTKDEGTLATFTAASNIRRNLQTAGFEVSKRKGFGKKREMITATKTLQI